MRTRLGPIPLAVLAAFVLVVRSRPAYAYLDPGTGSILLQMLLGGVAGALVVVKLYWARIKAWFAPRAALPKAAPEDDEGPGGA